jgi:hypothetical protein
MGRWMLIWPLGNSGGVLPARRFVCVPAALAFGWVFCLCGACFCVPTALAFP